MDSVAYDFRIERRALQEPAAQPFQRWLGEWKNLRNEGWDATVLLAADGTHVVGLAFRNASTIAGECFADQPAADRLAQQSLFA